MRKLLVLCSFWLCVATLGAQNAERKLYSVAFYNLENLFDTIHDAGKNDYEFLPDGSYQWTAKKYESKLQNLSKVLGSLSRDLVPEGPAFIGVAEAENSKEELESVCGLGTVTGLCGANCYHSYSPFTPGITPRTYTDEQLDKMNAEENKPVEYNGKTYTKYEATQRQRRLETTMRAQRQKIKLLEEGGADEQAIINARARYVKTSDEYVNFSKSVGLSQQWDRVTVGGSSVEGITKPKKASSPIGGIKTTSLPIKNTENHTFKGKFGVEKSGGSGIIKEENKKPITPITDKAIERVPKVDIAGYSEEQRVEIQKQHKELLKFSKEQNDNKEVAFVFRDGLVDYKPFTGSDEKIDFGTYLETKGKNLTILHNHPRNSSYSMNDLDVFANKNVRTITIVKNNGTVEYLTKTDDFDNNRFALECNRLYKKIVVKETDEEKDRFVKTLLNKSKAGVIWSGRK